MEGKSLEERVAALASMSLAQLREKWSLATDKPLPRVSAGLLRLALAWELQATVHGGLSPRTQRTLDQLARGRTETREVQPGMRLMREWNGTLHVVNVHDDGAIHWNGQRWNSLSHVARAITGTRWSGPAFFGLKTRKAA